MRILVSARSSSLSARIWDGFTHTPSTAEKKARPAIASEREVVTSAPQDGVVSALLSRHPLGSGFDMVVAEDEIDRAKNMWWTRILLEWDLFPDIPVVLLAERFEEKLKVEGVFPHSIFLLEPPFTFEGAARLIESKVARLIEREESDRAAAIEGLMRISAASDLSTAIDDLYMGSARRLQKFLQLAPWSPLPSLAMGRVYAGCNRHQTAIPHLKAAITIDFGKQDAHRLLARCYRRTGQSFDEVEELEEMLVADPGSSELLLRMGEAFLREGDWEAAADYFRKAIENYKPGEVPRRKAKMHVGLGKSYVKEAQAKDDAPALYVKATTEFDVAMRTDPTLVAAYNNLVLAYRKMQKFNEAKQIMEKAVALMPVEAEDWGELFEMYLASGDAGKAKYALRKAEKLDPDNQRILCSAGELYIRQSMFPDAVDMFEKALALNPSDIRLYNYLGICNRHMGRVDEAIRYYRTALTIDPDDQNIHFNLGKALLQQGERENAAASFRKALAIDPGFVQAKKAAEAAEVAPKPGEKRNIVR